MRIGHFFAGLAALLSASPAAADLTARYAQGGQALATAGQATPGLTRAMAALLGRGALLRFGDMWRLESIDTTPLHPAIFALPGAPISREQLRERLRARRPL